MFIFLIDSFLGNFYRHLVTFYWSHCLSRTAQPKRAKLWTRARRSNEPSRRAVVVEISSKNISPGQSVQQEFGPEEDYIFEPFFIREIRREDRRLYKTTFRSNIESVKWRWREPQWSLTPNNNNSSKKVFLKFWTATIIRLKFISRSNWENSKGHLKWLWGKKRFSLTKLTRYYLLWVPTATIVAALGSPMLVDPAPSQWRSPSYSISTVIGSIWIRTLY